MAMATVFINGRIFAPSGPASNTRVDFYQAMSIVDDRIVHVGHDSDEQIRKSINAGATVVNLQDRVLMASFIDSHVHILGFSDSLRQLDTFQCKNVEDIRELVRTYAQNNPSERFIICKGWIQATTGSSSTAAMLDDLDLRPIFINSLDAHSVWCNTAAMEAMKLDSVPEPAGGIIYRDENGRPTGLLAESAVTDIVWPYLAQAASTGERLAGLEMAVAAYSAAGYTGIIDMAMDDGSWATLIRYREEHRGFPFHVAAHWYVAEGR